MNFLSSALDMEDIGFWEVAWSTTSTPLSVALLAGLAVNSED